MSAWKQLVRLEQPGMSLSDILSVTTLVPINDELARFERIMTICQPRLVLFLDEQSSECRSEDMAGFLRSAPVTPSGRGRPGSP